MRKTTLLTFLATGVFSAPLPATVQYPDILIVAGEEHRWDEFPLEEYFDSVSDGPPPLGPVGPCTRGFTGTWEITDGELLLVGLRDCETGEKSVWNDTLPDVAAPLHAYWYDGIACVAEGSILPGFSGAYSNLRERDSYLVIVGGRVIHRFEVANAKAAPLIVRDVSIDQMENGRVVPERGAWFDALELQEHETAMEVRGLEGALRGIFIRDAIYLPGDGTSRPRWFKGELPEGMIRPEAGSCVEAYVSQPPNATPTISSLTILEAGSPLDRAGAVLAW